MPFPQQATGKLLCCLTVSFTLLMLTNLQDLEFHGCDGNVSLLQNRLGVNVLLTLSLQARCV
jgi:hypothetical protein